MIKARLESEAEAVNHVEHKPIDYIFCQTDVDIENSFKRCSLLYNSVDLYRGRLYKYPRPINLRNYDKLYGTSASDLSDGWLNEEEQGHVVDNSIVKQLDPSITLFFSTDDRLTFRGLSSVIRKRALKYCCRKNR